VTAERGSDGRPIKVVPPPPPGDIEQRIDLAMSEAFVERAVVPFIRTPQSPLEVYEATVVRDIGTGRVTIRYDFGQGRVAFGKLYADETGHHAYRILGRLWSEGFGAASPHRVTQPLVYMPQEHFLLTRGVPGAALTELIDGPEDSLTLACHDAARWLVRLHTLRVPSAARQPLWESLRMSHTLRRLMKACEAVPEAREALTGMLKAVWTKGGDPQEPVGPVLTHGRFHHEHIFLCPGVVSVIDFDGCVPSDPARDLAEFLTQLRSKRFKRRGELGTTDAMTRAFLSEYLGALPWNGANLSLYWGAFALESALRQVKKAKGDGNAIERTMEYLSRELFDILNGKFVPPELRAL
jgi:hypothetical protein